MPIHFHCSPFPPPSLTLRRRPNCLFVTSPSLSTATFSFLPFPVQCWLGAPSLPSAAVADTFNNAANPIFWVSRPPAAFLALSLPPSALESGRQSREWIGSGSILTRAPAPGCPLERGIPQWSNNERMRKAKVRWTGRREEGGSLIYTAAVVTHPPSSSVSYLCI